MMKAIVVLFFMLVYIVNNVSCQSFLSKFHQNSFKLKDVRMELISFDPNYYNFFRVATFKYNRTVTAHNMTFNYAINTQDKVEVIVQIYKFLSNEYRKLAVRFEINVLEAYQENAIGIAEAAKKCGNFTTAYFSKDITYHLCNFVVDETHFPPLIPSGIYKMQLRFMYLSRRISTVDLFAEVYTPIKYPKKPPNSGTFAKKVSKS